MLLHIKNLEKKVKVGEVKDVVGLSREIVLQPQRVCVCVRPRESKGGVHAGSFT